MEAAMPAATIYMPYVCILGLMLKKFLKHAFILKWFALWPFVRGRCLGAG